MQAQQRFKEYPDFERQLFDRVFPDVFVCVCVFLCVFTRFHVARWVCRFELMIKVAVL